MTQTKPRRRRPLNVQDVHLILGDALDELRRMPTASIDAVITDPPYSSGGFTRGDRIMPTEKKYELTGVQNKRSGFGGDNRDARSWCYWMTLWLTEAHRVTKPGGYVLTFIDWRQYPMCSDALQAGGWVWRGTVAWDKTEGARSPNSAYFRHQAEYILWGSHGALSPQGLGPWPGVLRYPVLQSEKHHMTGKPVGLMRQLVQVCPVDGLVLDPFMGSGTTGLAARMEKRRFVGIETNEEHYQTAVERIGKIGRELPLFTG